MKTLLLTSAAITIGIFWMMLSMVFESVVFQHRSMWHFLPWWFCDVVATVAGIASFAFVWIWVNRKWGESS